MQLGEVEMSRRRVDVAEDRSAAEDMLPFTHDREDVDVPVLGVQRADREPRRAEDVRDPVGHRIDRRSARRGDVDPVVKAEQPRPVEADGRLVEKDRPRITEVRADRMGPVERL
jgi:hypothetical protein